MLISTGNCRETCCKVHHYGVAEMYVEIRISNELRLAFLLLYSCYSVWMFLGVLLCNYYGIPVWLLEVFDWGIAMQLLGCPR